MQRTVILPTLMAVLTAVSAAAATYTVDFEDGTKAAYAAGDVTLNGVSWRLDNALVGNLAADKKNGLKSARMRHQTAAAASMTMNADQAAGIGTVTLLYARYGTDATAPTLVLEYSTDAGATWTQAGAAFSAAGVDALTPFTADVSQPGAVRLRIRTTAGTNDKRANVDDIVMTEFGGSSVSNLPPVITPIGAKSVRPGEDLSFDVVAADPADGDEVVLTATNLPAGALFGAVTNVGAVTNTFFWSGAEPAGDYEVFFLASDVDGTTTQRVPITVAAPVLPSLLISEYGEGTSYNKYIEIFNYGTNTADLSQYALKAAFNGTSAFNASLTLSGALPFNTAYVVANDRADAALKAKANLLTANTCMNFNGDDAVGLFRSGALLDLAGYTNSPTKWGENVSLIRKSSVTEPSTTYLPAQWNGLPVNSWGDVGTHTMNGLPAPAHRPPVLNAVNNQVVTQGSNLVFTVTAQDTVDGDEIRLWAAPVPAGATFAPVTNLASATGTFAWYSASPTGTYATTFFAGDKDGTNSLSISMTVVRAVAPTQSVVVLINEIQANDNGTDDAEFVELVGLSGVNLRGCRLVHYNGSASSDGGLWAFTFPDYAVPTSGVMDVEGRDLGFVVLAQSNGLITAADFWLPKDPSSSPTNLVPASLQNGSDGLVLYDGAGEVLDAAVWPAWGTTDIGDIATDDPGPILATSGDTAMPNYLHVLPADPSSDENLQAPDNVLGNRGSGWPGLTPTPGAINGNQTSGQIIMTRPKPVKWKGLLFVVR